MQGADLQLRSADRAIANLKSPHFSSHFRSLVSLVPLMNLFVIALEANLWRNFRSYFSMLCSNLLLTYVTSGIDFFITEDVIGLFFLDCLLPANGVVVSIEVVVCRFKPIRIIHADLSNSHDLYAGWTKNYFLSLMTSLSMIFRFQLDILLLGKRLSLISTRLPAYISVVVL